MHTLRTALGLSITAAFALFSIASLSGGLAGEEAEQELTARIILSDGEGDELVNPSTDESITVQDGTGGAGHTGVQPGSVMTVSIPFNAPNGNVVGAGIRFGENGPIRTIPIDGAQGQTNGTLQFDFQVPQSVCDNLSQICHDIKCYEFAVTEAGEVSQANINQIALACNNCEEPSCRDLLPDCFVGQCSSAAQACNNGQDLQSCVEVTIGGNDPRCWYEVGGDIIPCPDCQNLEGCAQQAVDACSGD